ncbi:MAG TPA: sigma-70 family RNA polymerase sigma factor [Pirellulales bacterium]|nr:sigma-70 family RNA polymerase sigma factor [Pirellulales bacterium]
MAVRVRLGGQEFTSLLCDARHGSSAAAGKLLSAFHPMLVEYAHEWLCPELRRRFDPCDLAQYTMSQAIERLGETRARSVRQFAAWLKAILRHRAARLACRYVRRRDGLPRPRMVSLGKLGDGGAERDGPRAACGRQAQVLVDSAPSPEDEAVAAEEAEVLHGAMGALTASAARAVWLRVEQGLSFSAIGKKLGLSAEAARCKFRRAMAVLRRKLGAARGP